MGGVGSACCSVKLESDVRSAAASEVDLLPMMECLALPGHRGARFYLDTVVPGSTWTPWCQVLPGHRGARLCLDTKTAGGAGVYSCIPLSTCAHRVRTGGKDTATTTLEQKEGYLELLPQLYPQSSAGETGHLSSRLERVVTARRSSHADRFTLTVSSCPFSFILLLFCGG